MRVTSKATKDAWLSGNYTGANRPIVRATIQRLNLCVLSYGKQQYSSVPFGQLNRPVELPNIRDVTWHRTTTDGVATMTMNLYNTEPLPIGQPPEDGDFDQPGYFSPARGHSTRWHRSKNGWQDWIVPDRIIRTYEGYGFDVTKAPEVDPHLYQSGTWRIDTVAFVNDGTGPIITVTCRDIGSVLLDQIAFPPVVPFACYPVWFETAHPVPNPPIVTSAGGWFRPAYEGNSNTPWVGDNTAVCGHHATDAFDTSDATYWLSIGNANPSADFSFEFIQGKFSSRTVAGGQFHVWGGPYTCYVSVYAGGAWQGDQMVPYNPKDPVSAPNGSDIRFVTSFHVNSEQTISFNLPHPIAGATSMRLTFTNLCNSGIGPYVYRAGVRSFTISDSVSHSSPGGSHIEPTTSPPAIKDYTDIVKIFLAWAGFYWPREKTHAILTYSNGTTVIEPSPSNDPALIQGRVWGDFMQTGTAPIVDKTGVSLPIPVSVWDKKPIMDCIAYVRDIVGFIFFIDETGGAVFRLGNNWSVGNWIGDGGGRTSDVITIDETQTLTALTATLSGQSIREKIFVGNISGQIAAMADGHNPYPSGLRRTGGYTDQHFATTKECQIMADLITLNELFTYRTDAVTIAANPAIQIDDQVRIYERTSEETYLQYVSGITMNWSVETGKYTYNLDTHWLGDTAFSNWTFNPKDLSAETRQYLKAMGAIK